MSRKIRHKYPALPGTAPSNEAQLFDTVNRVREALQAMFGVGRSGERLRVVNIDDLIRLGLITEKDIRKLD